MMAHAASGWGLKMMSGGDFNIEQDTLDVSVWGDSIFGIIP